MVLTTPLQQSPPHWFIAAALTFLPSVCQGWQSGLLVFHADCLPGWNLNSPDRTILFTSGS